MILLSRYQYSGRHRGVYRPLKHWTCDRCSENCSCLIYLGARITNVRIFTMDGESEPASITFTPSEGLMTIPVLAGPPGPGCPHD